MIKSLSIRTLVWTFLLSISAVAAAAEPEKEKWISLFNGRDLDGWTVKIRGSKVGENFGDTFRVEDGVMKVGYEKYDQFGERFGHIFYKDAFSHYRLRVEYRFTSDQAPGGPGWAFRNSGLMLHGQTPQSMGVDQKFPVSIEVQLLGGNGSKPRTTANLCTAGHERRDGWQTHHPALHEFQVENLSRRPVGDVRGRGSWRQDDQALREWRFGDAVRPTTTRPAGRRREAADRPSPTGSWRCRRERFRYSRRAIRSSSARWSCSCCNRRPAMSWFAPFSASINQTHLAPCKRCQH